MKQLFLTALRDSRRVSFYEALNRATSVKGETPLSSEWSVQKGKSGGTGLTGHVLSFQTIRPSHDMKMGDYDR
jgi:hypothetical protein